MSMISAQIDELRKLADDIESRYGYPTAVKALRDAADTIWQLRDDLQRTNAEYAKLRDEFDKMDKWHSAELIAEMDENAKLRERADNLFNAVFAKNNELIDLLCENEKLRELVRDMRTCIGHACLCDFCPLFVAEEDIDEVRCIADMDSRMRELGVEVDG